MEEYDQEQIERLIKSLGPLPDSFNKLADSIKNANGGLGGLGDSAKDAANSMGTYSTAKKKATEAEQKHVRATEDNTTRSKAAYDQSIAALNTLGDALTNSQPSFADLGGVATNAGKSLGNLAENLLPAFGAQINVAIQLLGELSAAYLTQFAEQNEFGGQMRKMGVTVAEMGDGTRNTTDSMTDLAREAGYTSEMLSKIAGMMVKSSEAVALLGTNSTDGAKAFLEYSNISKTEQKRFARLGYTIEDLNAVQTNYIELQRASGINTKAQNLTARQLQKRSLEYAKSLTAISEITGRNAEQQIAAEQQQKAEYRNKIVSMNQQREISALEREAANETNAARKKELEDKAQSMKDELGARTQMTGTLARILGPDLAEQINTVMITGNFDETTTAIAQLGLNAGDLATAFEGVDPDKPEEVMAATQKILSDVISGQEDGLERFGDALIRMGADAEGFGKSVGLSAENLNLYQQAMDSGDEDKAREILKTALDNVNETTKSGKDTQLDFQAELEAMARSVRTASDGLLDFAGPAVLVLTAGAVVALGIAAAKAATSLALLGGPGGMKGMFKNLGTKGASLATRLAGSNAFKIGGGVATGAIAAYGSYDEGKDERRDIANDLADENIDQAEADRRTTVTNAETTGEMTGNMVGAVSGAFAGAKAGAMLGAFGGPVGVAIGGTLGTLIGAGLGAWAGGKGGSEVGEKIGSNMGASLEKDVRKANLALAEQSGFYDKKGAFKDSTVDFDKVKAAQKDKTLTQNTLQSMLEDNDMSDDDEAEITKILNQMKDANEGLETEKTVADAEQADIKKESEADEKLIADLGLDGDTQTEIDDAVVEVQKEMVTKTDLLKDSIDKQAEATARLIVATNVVAEITGQQVQIEKAKPEELPPGVMLDTLTGEFRSYAYKLSDTKEGGGLYAKNFKTAEEADAYQKSDQFGRDPIADARFKAKEAADLAELDAELLAERGHVIPPPPDTNNLVTDPDAQASDELAPGTEDLQLGKLDETQILAEQQLAESKLTNQRLGELLSKQTESNDLSEKIVQYSSV